MVYKFKPQQMVMFRPLAHLKTKFEGKVLYYDKGFYSIEKISDGKKQGIYKVEEKFISAI